MTKTIITALIGAFIGASAAFFSMKSVDAQAAITSISPKVKQNGY